MNGFLLIDKPKGWTSFDVVAKTRGLLSQQAGKKVKVGHAGTLDPMATGLLIVLVGSYTKKQDEFMKQDKVYEAEVTLGSVSDTYDAEGKISEVSSVKPSLEQVYKVMQKFIGEISQIPPIYSALKVNGKKAYELARRGDKMELKARSVKIYSINDIFYEYPRLSFTCKVSSGTYIRSLAHDIGQLLGCGAYLSGLKRTKIGNYDIENSLPISRVDTKLLFLTTES